MNEKSLFIGKKSKNLEDWKEKQDNLPLYYKKCLIALKI